MKCKKCDSTNVKSTQVPTLGMLDIKATTRTIHKCKDCGYIWKEPFTSKDFYRIRN